jgi:hypothetical protein
MSWAPIRKVLAGVVVAVIAPGVIAILDKGAGVINLSGGQWAALLISTFLVPLVSYLVPSAPGEPGAAKAAAAKK